MLVIGDDNDEDDGIRADIVHDVVVKVLKGAPKKITIDVISLDVLDSMCMRSIANCLFAILGQ